MYVVIAVLGQWKIELLSFESYKTTINKKVVNGKKSYKSSQFLELGRVKLHWYPLECKSGNNPYLESRILEVHDGVGDGDVKLQNDLLDVEGTRQAIGQAQ